MYDSSCCSDSQREAALLIGQFAAADSDCKVDNYFIIEHPLLAVDIISSCCTRNFFFLVNAFIHKDGIHTGSHCAEGSSAAID